MTRAVLSLLQVAWREHLVDLVERVLGEKETSDPYAAFGSEDANLARSSAAGFFTLAACCFSDARPLRQQRY